MRSAGLRRQCGIVNTVSGVSGARSSSSTSRAVCRRLSELTIGSFIVLGGLQDPGDCFRDPVPIGAFGFELSFSRSGEFIKLGAPVVV